MKRNAITVADRKVELSPASNPPYIEDAMIAMKNSGVEDGWIYGQSTQVKPVATATEPSGMTNRRTAGVISIGLSAARRFGCTH
jgi:hypothetical protein